MYMVRWLQSYLAGVPTLVLGGRDRGGVIREASTGGSIMPEAEEENPSPEMQGRSLAAPKRRGLAAAMVNQARGRWGRAKNMLLAASRVRRLALADNADFTRENTQALDAAVKGHINVVLNVEQTRDLSSINYAQQGNAAMYTPEVMSKRHSNRTDTSLIEVVRHWWRWLPKADQEVMEVAPAAPDLGRSAAVRFAHDSLPLPEPTAAANGGADTAAEAGSVGAGAEGAGAEGGSRTLQSRMSIHTRLDGGSGGVALDSGEASAGGGGGGTVLKVAALDRAIYSAMVVAITMVLLPRFGLKADPDYDPSEDWLDDNKGLPYMDFPNFFDAMFELADMWAEGTDVREYVELLLTTLHDVQKMDAADGTFSRLLKKFGYKSFREPRSQQGSGNWEGWDAAAGAAADADEGGSPPPDYGGVGGSGYGAAGAGGRWSPQRRGPFVMPAPAKVDYSGQGGRVRKEQGVGGIPLALRQAEVADPGAAGSGAVGGPGRGPGPVIHAYEEYMHDMAARYLSTQEALLVATMSIHNGYGIRLTWTQRPPRPQPPNRLAPGAGTIGSSGASPQASPRASGTVPSAGTTAAASDADAAANQATAVSDPALVASPSGSAGLTSRASRLGSRALLSCGASSHSLPATPRGGVSITVGPDATAAAEGEPAATALIAPAGGETEVEMAAKMSAFAPQMAGSDTGGLGVGHMGVDAAATAAQAEVVVAFAQAAYRLADPNVHSLLLPSRRPPQPAARHVAARERRPTPDYWFRPGHVAASSSERAATTAAALLGGAVSRRLCSLVSTSASCDLGSAGAGAGGGLPVGRTASGSNWFSAVPQLRLPGASGGSGAAGIATAPCSPGPGGGGGVWGYGGGRMSARGGGTAANGSGGGVVMPHGSMSNKLRTFYTTAPSGVVAIMADELAARLADQRTVERQQRLAVGLSAVGGMRQGPAAGAAREAVQSSFGAFMAAREATAAGAADPAEAGDAYGEGYAAE
eukprot:XP_001701427.1 predicted protein [Chlamydomonas reinhardtii]